MPVILFLLFRLIPSDPAQAQQYTKIEAGVGSDAQTYSDGASGTVAAGNRHFMAGVSGVGTYNLSPSLAVEGSVSYFPHFQSANLFYVDSGRELSVLGGVKMGQRFKRWGVYGKIEPGLATFSCGMNVWGPQGQFYYDCERRTHFAMQYGGVVDYSLTPRTVLRLDAAQMLLAEFDQVLQRGSNWEFLKPGLVAQHFDLRLSVEHRFGTLREVQPEPRGPDSTFDAGVLYGLHMKVGLSRADLTPDPGLGAWVSWNFNRHFSWDTSAAFFPRKDPISGQDGGNSFVGFSGIKAGIRRDKMGIFAKVRPGSIVFSRTLASITSPPPLGFALSWEKAAQPVLDTGGVVEVYPWRRFILRADAGEATIFYRPKSIPEDNLVARDPSQEKSSLLMSVGVGYRF
jgi:hypothetical protein